jgi:ADP-ribosyl-[dinitrogen reductase] hydrolase
MARDNTATLDRLFAEQRIALQRSELFDSSPPELPAEGRWDRVEGMLLGLAIGDSLGNTTEGLMPDERADRYGVIRDYLPHPYADGRPVGLPSDDSQLAFWMLEQLIQDDGLVPEHLAQAFCYRRIFGIGNTVAQFLVAHRYQKRPWYEAGQRSAGNGALMRIAPILVPHLQQPGPGLWVDAALAAMITHNDPASTGSCLALVRMLWEALGMTQAPPAEWWLETFCSMLRPLEGDTSYATTHRDADYRGPLWRFTEDSVRQALAEELPVVQACSGWYSGAYLLETVPSVLYILCRHADDPEEAIVRAVNDTVDNDTIGAVMGAVVGALHGRNRLPQRWVDGLLGRTGAADDGRVFQLIAEARERWG